MVSSDKFAFVAFEMLEIMNESLINTLRESHRLADINASLIMLARMQRSGSLHKMDFQPEYESHKQLPLDNVHSVLIRQMTRSLELASESQEALSKSQAALDKELESKNREILDFKQELDEQRRCHEIELKHRDDRISQLTLQLEEKDLIENKREVSQSLLRCENLECREAKEALGAFVNVSRFLTNENRTDSELQEALGRLRRLEEEDPTWNGMAECIFERNSQHSQVEGPNYSTIEDISADSRQELEIQYHRIDSNESDSTLEPMEELLADTNEGPEVQNHSNEMNEAQASAMANAEATVSDDFSQDIDLDDCDWNRLMNISDDGQESDAASSSTNDVASSTSNNNASFSTYNSSSTSRRSHTIPVYPLGAAPKAYDSRTYRKTDTNQSYPERSIHVSNLGQDVTSLLLEETFGRCGIITNIVIKIRTNPAYAFLTFETLQMANQAKSMALVKIGERWCKVGPVLGSNFKVRVKGFSKETTKTALRNQFMKCGIIHKLVFEGRSTAIVHFTNKSSVDKAVATMNGLNLAGNSTLKVEHLSNRLE